MGLERHRAECVVPVFSQPSNLWPQAWHTLPRVVGQRFTQEEELALLLSSCVVRHLADENPSPHTQRWDLSLGCYSVLPGASSAAERSSHSTLSCFPTGSCKVLEEAQYTTQGRTLGRRGADDQRVTYMRMLGSHSAGSSESLYRPQQPAPSRCPHGSALGRSVGQRSSQLTHYRL